MKAKMKDANGLFLKILFFSLFLGASFSGAAQDDKKAAREAKKYMKEAEAALADDDFATAEAYYRQAIAKDPSNATARYNLGNLYYNKDIAPEAVERHSQAAKVTEEKPVKHNSFHNQGNAYMKQKKYREAIESYKNSLRNNPNDDETRYNLALAREMLEDEQKGGGGGDDQDENEDEQQDQQPDQDQQGEEQEDDEGDPRDQEGGDKDTREDEEGENKQDSKGKPEEDQQQDPQTGDEQQDPRQQQPLPGQLSPQQIKNLLEAMGNEEKKVQDKINAEKAKGAKTKSEKDW